jgi:group I intron endonuclease
MNKDQSGVYKVTHIANGKTYIGGTKRLKRRQYEHLRALHLGNHYASELQLDFINSATGNTAVQFEVLEYCDLHEVVEREKHHISIEKPAYNKSVGGSGVGRKIGVNEREAKRKNAVGKQLNFKGTYQTPFGEFTSTIAAANAANGLISQPSIWNACKNPSTVINRTSRSQCLYLQQFEEAGIVGKTWGEIGFSFTPKPQGETWTYTNTTKGEKHNAV